MTLGELRKLTEMYPDSMELSILYDSRLGCMPVESIEISGFTLFLCDEPKQVVTDETPPWE
jgi:hypothetical protein